MKNSGKLTAVYAMVVFALMSSMPSVASAEAPYFSSRVLRGHDLNADGSMLVIALSDDGAGANPQVLISRDASFTGFRRLDLPDGYVWMHPAFSPDASHVAISGFCVDDTLCPEDDISNVYEVDLEDDSIERITPPQQGLYQFEPAYADNGKIHYLVTENVGSYTRSRSIGNSLIGTTSDTGELEIVFPIDAEITKPKDTVWITRSEVMFRFDRILEISPNRLAFLSGASSRFNVLEEGKAERYPEPADPRIRSFHEAVLTESQSLWSNPGWHPDLNDRIYTVTEDAVEFLTDDRMDRNAIQHRTAHAVDRLRPGRYLVAMSPFAQQEQFFIYENGVTTFLMDMPDGVQIVWNLAASSDASVIAYTRGAWFNLTQSRDVQPLEHRDALVIIRAGQPLQYLD